MVPSFSLVSEFSNRRVPLSYYFALFRVYERVSTAGDAQSALL